MIEAGHLFGRLEVLGRVPDGRYRLRCRGCGDDGVVASASALNRGRLTQCWNCVQEQRRKREQRDREAKRVAPRTVIPFRTRRDDCGWALREAA